MSIYNKFLFIGILAASSLGFADEVTDLLDKVERDLPTVATGSDPGQLAKTYAHICVLAKEHAMDARADLRLNWGYSEFGQEFANDWGRRSQQMSQICNEISSALEKQTIDLEGMTKLHNDLSSFYGANFIPAVSYSNRLKGDWNPEDKYYPIASTIHDQLMASDVLNRIDSIVFLYAGDKMNFVTEVMRRLGGYLNGDYLLSWQNATSGIFKTRPGEGWPVHLANAVQNSGTGRSGHLEAAELIARDLTMELYRHMVVQRFTFQGRMDDQQKALTVHNVAANFAFAYAR